MKIKKCCQWCGEPFIAHKMTTLYCSTSCINKAYKAKKRQNVSVKMEIEQQIKALIEKMKQEGKPIDWATAVLC